MTGRREHGGPYSGKRTRATRMIVVCMGERDRADRPSRERLRKVVDELLGQAADAETGNKVCRRDLV